MTKNHEQAVEYSIFGARALQKVIPRETSHKFQHSRSEVTIWERYYDD